MTGVLLFEGGASHSTGRLATGPPGSAAAGGPVLSGGPCNPIAQGVEASLRSLIALGRELLAAHPDVEAVEACAGIAGAVRAMDRLQIATGLGEAFGLRRVLVSTDIHPLLHANAGASPAVLAVAGTGASVLARDSHGAFFRLGARGPVFGDEGSAYQVAVSALRAAAHHMDSTGPQTQLAQLLPKAAGVADFEDLAAWSATASKDSIAALARTVSAAAEDGDAVARGCIETQARLLAELASAAVERSWETNDPENAGAEPPERPPVYRHGGLFSACSLYREAFDSALAVSAGVSSQAPRVSGLEAVHALAVLETCPEWVTTWMPDENTPPEAALPPTERAAAAEPLDALDAAGIVARMIDAESAVREALEAQAPQIASVVNTAAAALRAGGRILYVGAGTSGRLGVLDASECPPTFGVEPDRVLGILAGGDTALRHSLEGAEDDTAQAARDMAALQPGPADLVVGLAASGTTPYTLAALRTARGTQARTALVCCNPRANDAGAEFLIALDTGPEVLPGSTRLKAGTATKCVLNMISTGAMALSGHVFEGRMVGMRPTNVKLRARAERIVAELCGLDAATSRRFLDACAYDIRKAIDMARTAPEKVNATPP